MNVFTYYTWAFSQYVHINHNGVLWNDGAHKSSSDVEVMFCIWAIFIFLTFLVMYVRSDNCWCQANLYDTFQKNNNNNYGNARFDKLEQGEGQQWQAEFMEHSFEFHVKLKISKGEKTIASQLT